MRWIQMGVITFDKFRCDCQLSFGNVDISPYYLHKLNTKQEPD